VGCDVLLFRPVEKREEEEGDSRSGWRNTSAFVMSLSQNISFHDKALLSEMIDMALALTLFVRLISDRVKPAFILVLEVFLSW